MPAFSAQRWQELTSYLDEALDVPLPERPAWLASLRNRDAGIAADVEQLLAEHRAVAEERFMEYGALEMSLSGRTLGGFLLGELVAAGGFGDVYLAEQLEMRRQAVVKVLRPAALTWGQTSAFLREAELASRLDHPYAAHVYAFGAELDGVCWIAMEHVRGATLRSLLQLQGPMPVERFLPLLEKICEVVHSAHDQGIVHRDLKPENIMVVSRAGRLLPKLLDFGIARAVARPAPLAPPPSDPAGAADGHLAVGSTGTLMGSPPYMAPEQWLDAAGAGPQTDQYALAALAYEALTGRMAFPGAGVARGRPPPDAEDLTPLGPAFQPALEVVLRRAMSRTPADRFADVLAFAEAFRGAAGPRSTPGELPRMDEELYRQCLVEAPQPIADAVARFHAAGNAHQALEALTGVFKVAAWYVAMVALACRTRTGPGRAGDSEAGRSLLRELRTHGLQSSGWLTLARELTRPFAHLADAYPLPELVLLFHCPDEPLAAPAGDPFLALDRHQPEPLFDRSEVSALAKIAADLPAVNVLLSALRFLLDYPLLIARGEDAQSWMGSRGAPRSILPLRLPTGSGPVYLADRTGLPVVSLGPLVQVSTPIPGEGEQLFMLAGPGSGSSARLVSSPDGLEREDPDLWGWFRDEFLTDAAQSEVAASEPAPYLGLAPYTSQDAPWFFGREREIEVAANRLRRQEFLAVVGPSGVGKSSFVLAGLAPALGWPSATVRPGRSPLLQLDRGLELARASHDRPGGPALLIVDQFEELFTLGCSTGERETFVRRLLGATRKSPTGLRVVLTLRDDFLIRAEQLPELADALARGLQLQGPMGPVALRRVLVEPARRAGYVFEDPELPTRMIAAVADTPAAVALISYTAARLWDLRDRHFRRLPRQAYDSMGGVAGALARHADESLDTLPEAERALTRTLFRHLVTFEGTRAVLARTELEVLLGNLPQARGLIDHLLTARLLTLRSDEHGEPVVEIIHEALLSAWPRLVAWRVEDLAGTRFHQQLRAAARQWEDRGRPRGLLWHGEALAQYNAWRSTHTPVLTPLEAEFAEASVAEARRARNIRRASIAALVAVTSVFVAMQRNAHVDERRLRHQTESLLRDSTFEQGRHLMLQADPLNALGPLTEAYRRGRTGPEARLLIEEASRSLRARKLTLRGHQGVVRLSVYSPDGNQIATGGVDGTVQLWSSATGLRQRTLSNGTPVESAAFSPDGQWLALAGQRRVRLWDLSSGREIDPFILPREVRTLGFNRTGELLLATSSVGEAVVLTVPGLVRVPVLPKMAGAVVARFCERADCLVTGDAQGQVSLWETHGWQPAGRYRHRSAITAIAVDARGALVALGSNTGEVVVLGPGGHPVQQRTPHAQAVTDIAFSLDGTSLATASREATVLWKRDAEPGRLVLAHRAPVTALAFAPDGDILATGGIDGTVRIWSATGTLLGDWRGHTAPVPALSFRPDGRQLVSGSFDGQALVWDVATGSQFRSFPPARAHFGDARRASTPWGGIGFSSGAAQEAVFLDRTGTRVAALVDGHSISISSTERSAELCRARSPQRVVALALDPAGATFATVSDEEPVVRVWRSHDCAPAGVLVGHSQANRTVVYAPSGELVTGGNDGTVRVWNPDQGRLLLTNVDYSGPVDKLGFTPEGQLYARMMPGNTRPSAVVTQPLHGGARRTYEVGSNVIADVVFDPVQRRVLAVDRTVLLVWDRDSGALKQVRTRNRMTRIAISPDGKRIVTLGAGSPTVWDGDTLAELGVLEGHAGPVHWVGFIQDTIAVTAGEDETGRVWDVGNRQQILTLPSVRALAFSADRRTVALSSLSSLRLWRPTFPVPRAE